MKDRKPCLFCDKPLDSVLEDWDTMQPYGGGEVRFIFSFGSCKFDNRIDCTEFQAVICDECGEKYAAKMEEIHPLPATPSGIDGGDLAP